ncbi:hypothetical protein [Deinococcus ruber]|uniref:Uncharacterized protein n=1 Tax=Deinococcus ruber TaxID=1848197 RepID=A0A918C9G8_9DEIO|nr:hypothetical protein [Deinococcus ruber]GGR11542.1 hypothetical protein GCM10008957_25600 [Deinococcus ruber]
MDSLLADLLSQAPDRVLTSASAVNHTRDAALLTRLAAALPQIRRQTQDLDLGGLLFPNSQHVQQAIRVIENHQSGGCFCQVYPGYVFYNPEAEAQAGHVRITRQDAPDWNMTYDCVCTVCGRTYAVQQGEYHYTWWEWRAVKDGLRP